MNWALIGYGGMGHWHVNQLKTMPELINIAGIYDILEEKRVEAEANGLKAYPSLEALLADPEIDFITIATPNDFHRPIAIQAMAAGKHVISEKPVTMTADDLQAMIDAAKKYDRIFSVHQNRRWDEDYRIIKKLYDENTLGRVFNIESRVHGSRGIPGDWRNKKLQGGGMILDWGVHMLDQLLQIVPENVVSVYNVNSHVTNDEVDDGFKAVITFASGVTAQVEVGTSNFINLPRWYIQGENGTAIIKDWDCSGEIVMVSDWEKRDAVPVVTAAGLTKTMAPRTEETIKRYPLPRIDSDVRDYYRNFIKAMNGEETQLVTHPQMMRVVKLMEALQKSAELNEVVHSRI
ncbi:MAG: Gfo/Idh/MocA family oxidoreductase [Clostridia bacterium]|nr:Gfo/Idh/MocA family oxidoreductase [Clostridia bacterium]